MRVSRLGSAGKGGGAHKRHAIAGTLPKQYSLPTRIQVGGGLIKRQDAAVQAEGLRQRQADDEAGQHLSGQRQGRAEQGG